MKLSIDDIKEIVNKVTNGGGNYTPLEGTRKDGAEVPGDNRTDRSREGGNVQRPVQRVQHDQQNQVRIRTPRKAQEGSCWQKQGNVHRSCKTRQGTEGVWQ